MIVLDTTVLLYAVGTEHELREPCRRLLAAPKRLALTATAGVIQEFVHVRSRRRPRSEAVSLGRSYLTLLRPLLDVPDAAVDDALSLLGEHASLGAFDAVLAAAALRAGCRAVVTADRAFTQVDDLPVVFPDQAGVATLLSPGDEGEPRSPRSAQG
ncbi:type II toxin-antitoxin system VapC family toxin [Pseudonocardia asaccharolytica]|uniref:Ribonuclease VapC n=1 Tax=Pseudonocardia asaccharolytica DSM 44247 = NBRC 16224 TaxID=1123024 RepID=A0A511CZ12_9PSEU|nr:type II toxin-antitoxin system VapC family toxin [Pseudonocardia asaccharolytica]GEL17766.1 ribonuclease VapC [Pseudonocardia asaccharolytica DSM 44247 = NBRC 16224]